MVFISPTNPTTSVVPYAYALTPLNNISPLTYRDGTTYLEMFEQMRQWLNDSLVPAFNDNMDNMFTEFTAELLNNYNNIEAVKGGWQTSFDAFVATTNANIDAFKVDVNSRVTDLSNTIITSKNEWQTLFDQFMADVTAQIAILNDNAIKSLLQNDTSATGSYTRSLLDSWSAKRVSDNVSLYGIPGDVNSQFEGAMQHAIDVRVPSPSPVFNPDPVGQSVIELGAGIYKITELRGLMGKVDPASKAFGLKFKGAGSGMTIVQFEPAVAGEAAFNDYWLGLRFEGITFICETPGSTFMQSYTTHAAQDYIFTDVYWRGNWKYIFDLQGNNNNSEFRFYGCGSSSIQAGGAFLYIGNVNTTDQFLNYWFYGHKHWSTDAPIIDAARGGQFHFYGLDVSDWGGGLTAPGYVFNLRGTNHSLGACTFSASAVRVEAKNAFAGLLYSEWPQGNVSFDSMDFSSQMNTYTYGDIIAIKYANTNGAIYNFKNCYIVGGVNVAFLNSDWQKSHAITFEDSTFFQRLTPSEVVTYDTTNAGANLTYPRVSFVRCRGAVNTDISVVAGESTWDAVMGSTRGETLMPMMERELCIRGVNGLGSNTSSQYVNLPIGAIVTGARVVAAGGGTVSTGTGTWSIKTTDATPVEIVNVPVTTPFNAGFNVETKLVNPFYCGTRAQASITVSTTATNTNARGMVILKGYW